MPSPSTPWTAHRALRSAGDSSKLRTASRLRWPRSDAPADSSAKHLRLATVVTASWSTVGTPGRRRPRRRRHGAGHLRHRRDRRPGRGGHGCREAEHEPRQPGRSRGDLPARPRRRGARRACDRRARRSAGTQDPAREGDRRPRPPRGGHRLHDHDQGRPQTAGSPRSPGSSSSTAAESISPPPRTRGPDEFPRWSGPRPP